jgi:hypothetical protein
MGTGKACVLADLDKGKQKGAVKERKNQPDGLPPLREKTVQP